MRVRKLFGLALHLHTYTHGRAGTHARTQAPTVSLPVQIAFDVYRYFTLYLHVRLQAILELWHKSDVLARSLSPSLSPPLPPSLPLSLTTPSITVQTSRQPCASPDFSPAEPYSSPHLHAPFSSAFTHVGRCLFNRTSALHLKYRLAVTARSDQCT